MLTEFGLYLRRVRDEMNISLRGFSELAEISPALLSHIELGRRDVTTDVAKKIFSAIGNPISWDEFVEIMSQSNKKAEIELRTLGKEHRELGVLLARNMGNLSKDAVLAIYDQVEKDLKNISKVK